MTFLILLQVIPPNVVVSKAYIIVPVLLGLVVLLICCITIVLVNRGRKASQKNKDVKNKKAVTKKPRLQRRQMLQK